MSACARRVFFVVASGRAVPEIFERGTVCLGRAGLARFEAAAGAISCPSPASPSSATPPLPSLHFSKMAFATLNAVRFISPHSVGCAPPTSPLLNWRGRGAGGGTRAGPRFSRIWPQSRARLGHLARVGATVRKTGLGCLRLGVARLGWRGSQPDWEGCAPGFVQLAGPG